MSYTPDAQFYDPLLLLYHNSPFAHPIVVRVVGIIFVKSRLKMVLRIEGKNTYKSLCVKHAAVYRPATVCELCYFSVALAMIRLVK